MTRTVIINKNCQVLLPEEIRVALNIRPGDELLIQLKGSQLVLSPKHTSYAHRLRGLHKEVWKNVDATEYVQQERESWE